jgi:subtilisin family serine protease
MAALGLSGAASVSAAPAQSPAKARAGEVVIQVPGMSGAGVDALAARSGFTVVKPVAYCPGFYVLKLKTSAENLVPEAPNSELTSAIDALKRQAGVANAAPNWMYYAQGLTQRRTRATLPPAATIVPNDPLYSSRQLWHMEMIRMPEAWNIQSGTRPIIAGVVDSGIDGGHPDFAAADGSGRSRVIAAKDFIDGKDGVDEDGHGTHVAGTVAASTNNGTGVVGVAGWGRGGVSVNLVDGKALNRIGTGTSVSVAEGIGFCIDNSTNVINMSLGAGGSAPSPVILDAVNRALRANVVVVAAAGNSSEDNDRPGVGSWPADISGVIKVTAVGPNKKLTSYSNYGGSKTLIAAPGGASAAPADDVWSTWPRAGASIAPGQNGYNGISGTSMACPHVAGLVALMLAAGAPQDPAKIYTALATTAQVPVDTDFKLIDDRKYGPGIIDAYSALYPYSDPPPTMKLVGGTDRGISYFNPTPITIAIRGVKNAISAASGIFPKTPLSDITVEIQTVGRTPTTLYKYTAGRGIRGVANQFEIPVLTSAQAFSTEFTVQVPTPADGAAYAPPVLSPGQYKIVARVRYQKKDPDPTKTALITTVEEDVQFITIAQKTLSAGRSMFAMPFRADLYNKESSVSLTPEKAVLGTISQFSLALYNPLRLPSDDDYARFRSNDPANAKSSARFDLNDTLDGRVIAYDTTDLATSVAPIGRGYWLDLDRATAIDTSRLPYPGQIAGVNPVADNAVGIRTYASGGGWNMIGAPFTYSVDWSVVTIVSQGVSYTLNDAINAGIISPILVGYDRGDYVYSIAPSGQLEPFNAYWIRVYRNCTVVVPPVPSASISRSRGTGPVVDGWRGRLVASVSGDQDGQNYFGQASGATDLVDRKDIPKPPAGAGKAYVRFLSKDDQGETRALAFDMKSSATAVKRGEWTAVVTSTVPNSDVVLSWDGIRSAPRGTRLVIKDTVTHQVIPMGSRSSYTYRAGEAGATREFKISLESAPIGGALTLRNFRVVTTRAASSALSFRFQASHEAEIQGTLQTLSGRTIGVLTGATRAVAGQDTTLQWNARAADGTVVPAGPYRVVISARTSDGSVQTIQRMIQVLR